MGGGQICVLLCDTRLRARPPALGRTDWAPGPHSPPPPRPPPARRSGTFGRCGSSILRLFSPHRRERPLLDLDINKPRLGHNSHPPGRSGRRSGPVCAERLPRGLPPKALLAAHVVPGPELPVACAPNRSAVCAARWPGRPPSGPRVRRARGRPAASAPACDASAFWRDVQVLPPS